MRILFVCMGNICRSPMAEGVMRSLLREHGRDDVEVDSAGTLRYHVGEPPDPRAVAAGARRGFVLDGAARQVTRSDLASYDLLVALDGAVARDLVSLARGGDGAGRVRLLREFDPAARGGSLDVPDPYYGGAAEFETALELVVSACQGLLEQLDGGDGAAGAAGRASA